MTFNKIKTLFTFSLLALAVFAVWEARKWSIQASLMPLLIGIPTVLLLGLQCVRELCGRDSSDPSSTVEKTARSLSSSLLGESETATDPAEEKRRTASIVCWILGFALGIWLLGFQLGITILTLSYLKGSARESWLATLSLTGAVWAGTTLLFDCAMHIFFAEGELFVWLGLSLNPFYTATCHHFMGLFK